MGRHKDSKGKPGRPPGSKNKIKGEPPVKKNEGGQPGNKNAEKWTEGLALQLGNELIEWLLPKLETDKKTGKTVDVHAANIFKIEFLAIYKRLHKDIIADLAGKFGSFADLLKTADNIQEAKLLKHGSANNLNAGVTCFVLKNHHGYADKVELAGNVGNRPHYDYSKLSDRQLRVLEKTLAKAEAKS